MPVFSTDLALIFALEEEFRVFYPRIRDLCRADADPKTGRVFLLFETGEATKYRCVTSFVGAMGAQDASYLTARVLDRYAPRTVIVVGIAGSLSSDIKIGDVVIAEEVEDYLQDARVSDQGFVPAGRHYRSNARLNNTVRYLPYGHAALWNHLSEASVADIAESLPSEPTKDLVDVIRTDQLMCAVGHIASGPVVGANTAFAQWLRQEFDRKYLALEMESAGVMSAVYEGSGDERVMIVRAISDLSDERKTRIDELGRGALRAVAMRNALRVIDALVELGAFERSSSAAETELAPSGAAQSGPLFVNVGEQSPEEWIREFRGHDPILASRALDFIAARRDVFLPLVLKVVEDQDKFFDWHVHHRAPILFGRFGSAVVPYLLPLLNDETSRLQAQTVAKCFRYLPCSAPAVAERLGDASAVKSTLHALGWMSVARKWAPQMEAAVQDKSDLLSDLALAVSLAVLQAVDISMAPELELLSRNEPSLPVLLSTWWPLEIRPTPVAEELLISNISFSNNLGILLSESRNAAAAKRLAYVCWLGSAEIAPAVSRYFSGVQDIDAWRELYHFSSLRDLAMLASTAYLYLFSEDFKEKAVWPWLDTHLNAYVRAQAFYTDSSRHASLGQIEELLDASDPLAAGLAAAAYAMRKGQSAEPTLRARLRFITTREARALFLAACIRAGMDMGDELHRELGEIERPLRLPFLCRRELVYAVSQSSNDGALRSVAWAELFGLSLARCRVEMERWLPFDVSSHEDARRSESFRSVVSAKPDRPKQPPKKVQGRAKSARKSVAKKTTRKKS